MASPCEILLDSQDLILAKELTAIAETEALRIQNKYSRYESNSLCSKINSTNQSVKIDPETFQLLEFANSCYELSDGLFDLTSGVLRKLWTFDGSSNIPSKKDVNSLLPLIGWEKVQYDQQQIELPNGMELDFGGIAKEYAVDRVCSLLKKHLKQHQIDTSVLINFGGDLTITHKKSTGSAWIVGVEDPTNEDNPKLTISITQGALATSGDARRFLLKDGKRYNHVLNPKTGWPIMAAPSSITVAAPQCTTAGILATLALLQGRNAENYLKQQQLKYWLIE
jgi:thiamine biosynthesis lipoprotein